MKLRVRLWVRMVVLIVAVFTISFYASTKIISKNYKEVSFQETFDFNSHQAKEYASIIKTGFDQYFANLSALSSIMENDLLSNSGKSNALFNQVLIEFLEENQQYSRVWQSWELASINNEWELPYGRILNSFADVNGSIEMSSDSLDLFGEDQENIYSLIKQSPEQVITIPEWEIDINHPKGGFLQSSLMVPIVKDSAFSGVVSADLNLDHFTYLLDSLSQGLNFDLSFFTYNGDIVMCPEVECIGENITAIDTVLASSFQILDRIQSGENSNFILKGCTGKDSIYYAISSFNIANTPTPWCILVSAPLSSIEAESESLLSMVYNAGKYGIVLIIILLLLFSFTLIRPLKRTTEVILRLGKGDVHGVDKMKMKNSDETRDMAESTNTLINGLNNLTNFANNIGEGNYDSKFELSSKNDILGKAILEMRDSLQDARSEEEHRKVEEENLNWASQGLNIFNRVLRVDNQNLDELSYQIIEALTVYLGAHMGGIYIKHSEREHFELIGHIGFPKEKYVQNEVSAGQGLVGQCIHEKDTVFINDVPDDYTQIVSGLGSTKPRSILVVPLINNLQLIGVLEIESLKDIQKFQIDFVEKLAESIASTISTVKLNVRTAQLLNQSQKQAEELEQQEEEMRQNMEEMQATQEEASKRENELEILIEGMKSILLVTQYDYNGNLIDVNKNYEEIFNIPKGQLLGKKHKSDVFMEESERAEHDRFWEELRNGVVKVQIDYYKNSKTNYWLQEYYLPVKNSNGLITKIICVGVDITGRKKTESEIQRVIEGVETTDDDNLAKEEAVSEINLSTELKVIDLTYLKMLYKSDGKKIHNILSLYDRTLPNQILELDDINKARDYKRLKSRINGLKSKMSYLGLKVIYEELRNVEKLIESNKNLNDIVDILKSVHNGWAVASKELKKLLNS